MLQDRRLNQHMWLLILDEVSLERATDVHTQIFAALYPELL